MSTCSLLMLSCIKNGYFSKIDKVFVPYSEINLKILSLLYKDGFISGYYFNNCVGKKEIVVVLKYFRNIYLYNYQIYSRPGRRIYFSVSMLKKKFTTNDFVMLSTVKGILWHKDALRLNIGGLALFVISFK